jgi:transcriptional regulator with XRE-family HTH domain
MKVHPLLFTVRLTRARKACGWNQADLAAEVGSSQSIVSRWERGVGEPTHVQLYRLSLALKVATDWLLGLSDEGGPPPPEREPIEADTETSAA